MEQNPAHSPALPEAEAMQLGYQPEAVRVRGLVIFVIIFVITAAVLHVGIWLLQMALESRNRAVDVPRSAVEADVTPAEHPLQPSVGHDALPYQDMEALRRQEDGMFQKLGWRVDPATHEADVPDAIIQRVAAEAKARAAGSVPATTTGRNTNTILPGPVPAYDTDPARFPKGIPRPSEGGDRP